MDATEFVDALAETCRDAAVTGVVAQLQRPSGRSVSSAHKQLSAWYNSLPSEQQAHAVSIIRMAADSTLFGVLCVLDGVRAVEGTPQKSSFRLTATKGKVSTVVSPGSGLLHDIYRSHP